VLPTIAGINYYQQKPASIATDTTDKSRHELPKWGAGPQTQKVNHDAHITAEMRTGSANAGFTPAASDRC